MGLKPYPNYRDNQGTQTQKVSQISFFGTQIVVALCMKAPRLINRTIAIFSLFFVTSIYNFSQVNASVLSCKNILTQIEHTWENATADIIIENTKPEWTKRPRKGPNGWSVITHEIRFPGLGSAQIEVLIIRDSVQVRVTNLIAFDNARNRARNIFPLSDNADQALLKRVRRKVAYAVDFINGYYKDVQRFSSMENLNNDNQSTEFVAAFQTVSRRSLDILINYITALQGSNATQNPEDNTYWYFPARKHWSQTILYSPVETYQDRDPSYGVIYTNNVQSILPLDLDETLSQLLIRHSEKLKIKNPFDDLNTLHVEVTNGFQTYNIYPSFEVHGEIIRVRPNVNLHTNPLHQQVMELWRNQALENVKIYINGNKKGLPGGTLDIKITEKNLESIFGVL